MNPIDRMINKSFRCKQLMVNQVRSGFAMKSVGIGAILFSLTILFLVTMPSCCDDEDNLSPGYCDIKGGGENYVLSDTNSTVKFKIPAARKDCPIKLKIRWYVEDTSKLEALRMYDEKDSPYKLPKLEIRASSKEGGSIKLPAPARYSEELRVSNNALFPEIPETITVYAPGYKLETDLDIGNVKEDVINVTVVVQMSVVQRLINILPGVQTPRIILKTEYWYSPMKSSSQ